MHLWLFYGAIISLVMIQPTSAQSLTQRALSRDILSREVFMQEGFEGSVAFVAGKNINSSEKARESDSLILLENGSCYRVLEDSRVSQTRRLYFAINHNRTESLYKNAFVAAQVLRFIPTRSSGSDSAFTRNGTGWITLSTSKKAVSFGDSKFLGRSIDQFYSAHALQNGQFDNGAISRFFTETADSNVEFHARLPRNTAEGTDGFYSSLDPVLSRVWTGLLDEFHVRAQRYQILMRNYLMTFDFGNKSTVPFVFYTDPVGSEQILVRIASSPGSGFQVDYTFSFAFGEDCAFRGP